MKQLVPVSLHTTPHLRVNRNSVCSVSPELSVSPVLLSQTGPTAHLPSFCALQDTTGVMRRPKANLSLTPLEPRFHPVTSSYRTLPKRQNNEKKSLAHGELLPQQFPQQFYCLKEEEREPWREELAKVCNISTSCMELKVPKIFKNNCRDVYPRPKAQLSRTGYVAFWGRQCRRMCISVLDLLGAWGLQQPGQECSC